MRRSRRRCASVPIVSDGLTVITAEPLTARMLATFTMLLLQPTSACPGPLAYSSICGARDTSVPGALPANSRPLTVWSRASTFCVALRRWASCAQARSGAQLRAWAEPHAARLPWPAFGERPSDCPQIRTHRPSRHAGPTGRADRRHPVKGRRFSSFFLLQQVAQDMCLLGKLLELVGQLFPFLRVAPLRIVLELCNLLNDECPQLLDLQLQFLR